MPNGETGPHRNYAIPTYIAETIFLAQLSTIYAVCPIPVALCCLHINCRLRQPIVEANKIYLFIRLLRSICVPLPSIPANWIPNANSV